LFPIKNSPRECVVSVVERRRAVLAQLSAQEDSFFFPTHHPRRRSVLLPILIQGDVEFGIHFGEGLWSGELARVGDLLGVGSHLLSHHALSPPQFGEIRSLIDRVSSGQVWQLGGRSGTATSEDLRECPRPIPLSRGGLTVHTCCVQWRLQLHQRSPDQPVRACLA
jgi:hypothetical protein